jgi:Cu/Ag efflux protein CusF
MAHRTLTLTLIVGLAVAVSACEQEQSAPSQSPQTGSQQSAEATRAELHTTTGTVTAVDASAGRVSLDHAPVASLEWPAMTMQFKAADPSLLNDIKVGDDVRFSFIQTESNEYIIQEISQK